MRESNVSRLLGAEFSFLPAEVVSPAAPAPVRVWRVAGSASPADLEEQPMPLSELLLHDISDRHRYPLWTQ